MEKYKRVSLTFMRSCSALNARLLNKLKFLQIKEKHEYQICSNQLHSDLKANTMSSNFSNALKRYDNKNKSVTVKIPACKLLGGRDPF